MLETKNTHFQTQEIKSCIEKTDVSLRGVERFTTVKMHESACEPLFWHKQCVLLKLLNLDDGTLFVCAEHLADYTQCSATS